ncbi:uncharacterized protein [Rutidosis leptorrhynchoides]|uniref:uncharacterized protein n=1 Tax=Rutidosis leptorrhynchoides TaxID=125765 RepID=UPI003A9951D3
MHWEWKNCPVAWKGQYISGHHKKPTLILEIVASYDMWTWHAYFGVGGSNNDINVLNQSPLFDSINNGTAPPSSFTVNSHDYMHGYYLADGIYPDWATLIKAYSSPTDDPAAKFTRFQESERKNVEHTFGILQGKFKILRVPGRSWKAKKMSRILYPCILLQNMIHKDNDFAITLLDEEYLREPENQPFC